MYYDGLPFRISDIRRQTNVYGVGKKCEPLPRAFELTENSASANCGAAEQWDENEKNACYEQAVDQAREALSLDPTIALAYSNLGHGLYKLGRVDEAILAYRQGIAISASDTPRQLDLATEELGELACIFKSQHDYSSAAAAYRQALKLDPNNESCSRRLANITQLAALMGTDLSAEDVAMQATSMKKRPLDELDQNPAAAVSLLMPPGKLTSHPERGLGNMGVRLAWGEGSDVFEHLDCRELGRCASVSKDWQSWAGCNKLWCSLLATKRRQVLVQQSPCKFPFGYLKMLELQPLPYPRQMSTWKDEYRV
jgi:tetratricopeptide (TPR) repeat protein